MCNQRVIFYIGFVADTLEETIVIYPEKWKNKKEVREKKNQITIFEEFGKPFNNLKKYLTIKGIIDEEGNLDPIYIPQTLADTLSIELGVWWPKPLRSNR